MCKSDLKIGDIIFCHDEYYILMQINGRKRFMGNTGFISWNHYDKNLKNFINKSFHVKKVIKVPIRSKFKITKSLDEHRLVPRVDFPSLIHLIKPNNSFINLKYYV